MLFVVTMTTECGTARRCSPPSSPSLFCRDLAATATACASPEEDVWEPPPKCARRECSTRRPRHEADSLSCEPSRCCFVRVYVREREEYLYLALAAVPVTPLAVACSPAAAQAWLQPRATPAEQAHALAALECAPGALGVSSASPLAGTGASAVVLRGAWQGRAAAVKVFRQGSTERHYANELRVLSHLGAHPSLVNVLGYCARPRALVLEYAALGSLFDLLHNERELVTRQSIFETHISTNLSSKNHSSKSSSSKSHSSETNTDAGPTATTTPESLLEALVARRAQIVSDIARGMEYLHSRHCVHLDLTSRNVLLTADLRAKITDYGLSVVTGPGELATRRLGHAPSYWKAPELAHRTPARTRSAPALTPALAPTPLLALVDESQSVGSPAVPSPPAGLSDASTPNSPAVTLQGCCGGGASAAATAAVPVGTEHDSESTVPAEPTQGRRVFTPKVDVFSFGMVLWELFHPGKFPWDGDLHPDVRLQHGERPPIAATVPPAWQMLIVACWQQCAAHRPSSHDIVCWLERNFDVLRSL